MFGQPLEAINFVIQGHIKAQNVVNYTKHSFNFTFSNINIQYQHRYSILLTDCMNFVKLRLIPCFDCMHVKFSPLLSI